MFRVIQKLKCIKNDLKKLNKPGFSNVEDDCFKSKELLLLAQNQLHTDPTNIDLAYAERLCVEQYRTAQDNYASFMHEISKIHWLEHGDEHFK